jgi:hypothetical protein
MRWQPYLERANSTWSWRLSSTSLERLRGEVAILTNKFPQSRALLEAVDENLSWLRRQPSMQMPQSGRKVFLSHRFAEEEFVKGLVRLLEENGFEIITGKASNTTLVARSSTTSGRPVFSYA